MVKILIEKGLDPTIHDNHGKLATEYARKAKFTEIADYLAAEVKKIKDTNKISSDQPVMDSSQQA